MGAGAFGALQQLQNRVTHLDRLRMAIVDSKMLHHELGGTSADSAVQTRSDKGTSNCEAGCCGHLKADYSNCYKFVANWWC